MASTATNGRPKLPPLNPSGSTEEGDKPKKKKVVKKKKPKEEGTDATGDEKPKATPRRKKAASADSTTEAGGETTAPKKKKRAPKKTETQEGDPTSARSGGSQAEDVSGSKASLIKSPKEGTPRKKKVKKKVKKTPENTATEGDDVFGSTLIAELTDIQDDIIAHDEKKDNEDDELEYPRKPYSTASVGVRSQPTEKFYIETDGGFKGENKSKFAKRQAEELKEKAVVHEEPKNTTIEFAISTHTVLRTFSLFCHGLLAGLALWHIVVSYVLLDFGDIDFIEHYRRLALPVQCLFYFLIALCTLSSLDRFDLANPRRGFLLKALTLQNGTVSILLYFAALIVSVSNGAYEDKIHLYDMKPYLWNNTLTTSDDLEMWRNLNTSRNILSIVGWFVISLSPLTDRLTENLRQTDDEELLGVEVETGKTAIA